MTEVDVAKLRSLAEKATPGPWAWTGEPGDDEACLDAAGADGYVLSASGMHTEGFVNVEAPDAEFIAAAHPATIIALLDRLEQAEAKPPAGWSSEDRQESKQEAERRWSRPVMREPEQRYQAGCINGFMLGAEWQKARETFISYRVIAGEAVARAERAEDAIERVRAMAEEMGEAIGFDRLVHGGEAEYPVSYFRDKLEEALEPVAALDTGKEKNDE